MHSKPIDSIFQSLSGKKLRGTEVGMGNETAIELHIMMSTIAPKRASYTNRDRLQDSRISFTHQWRCDRSTGQDAIAPCIKLMVQEYP